MTMSAILWRRLDVPGHDACHVERSDAGWELQGTAVFLHEETPARLSYHVTCDGDWLTQRGRVDGRLGAEPVDFVIARSSGGVWTLGGEAVSGLETCVDLDLGFTPATNLLPIRRLDLAEGEAADAPAAWLDVAAGTLGLLSQRYERRPASAYWYDAPDEGYAALLEVDPTGFVRRYPGLWTAEA